MKDCFFTLGGGQFWEDVMIYRDWRIQRNLTSRKFRLLDEFDIVRGEGGFEACLREWEKCKRAYVLPPLDKHLTLCLHSFGQTRKAFRRICSEFRARGMEAAAIDYPSMQRGIRGHIKQLEFVLNNLATDGVKEVSFVTFGCGNVVLEQLLAPKGEWTKRLKLGRAVEIAPQIRGSHLLEKLSCYKFTSFVLGAMAKELGGERFAKLHAVPDLEIGVIAPAKSRRRSFWEALLRVRRKFDSAAAIKSFCGAKELIKPRARENRALNDKAVCTAAAYFVQKGKF